MKNSPSNQKSTSKSKPLAASERFTFTRGSHAKETAEDYVEAIADVIARQGTCRGVDLAKLFRVTQVTITKTMARLQSEGLVEFDPYGPFQLTEAGRQMAAYSKQRHEIVLAFLKSIGIPDAVAEVDAEGIEHHVSPETIKAFKAMIKKNSK
jgi:DtxR family transcriptional regulator, manganese transport regulator